MHYQDDCLQQQLYRVTSTTVVTCERTAAAIMTERDPARGVSFAINSDVQTIHVAFMDILEHTEQCEFLHV
jgi:hypothetical protein